MAPSSDRSKRQPIRSFVLRNSRLTPAQARALDTLWPKFGINYCDSVADFARVFNRRAPLVVEIGFGNGDTLVAMADLEPEINFIGIEVHKPGVGAVLAKIEAAALTNVRIISSDAMPVLQHMIGAESLSGLRLYFPDPWPKKRHHKRRLVQPEFLELVAGKLAKGAVIHMATDWEHYAGQMLELLDANSNYRNTVTAGGFAERPAWRPLTHFEQRGTRLGHGVWDILYARC